MTSRFMWFDAETTGLEPDTCKILEVAAVLVDDDSPAMGVRAQYQTCVAARRPDFVYAHPTVQDMHTKNGLWEECYVKGVPLSEAQNHLIHLASQIEGKVVLAGGSVHFDLAFIRVHMPMLAKMLSHRVFDVSTLKAAERNWGVGFADIKADAHRALPDVMASLDEARAIRKTRWG